MENDFCPTSTYDDAINLENHLVAIKVANLGPSDPLASSDDYWSFMAEKWLVPTEEARFRQCQNCEYYDNTPKMLECIKESTLKASDLPVEPKWADVSAPSGYCEKYNITCTSIRSCLSWELKEDDSEEDMEEKKMNSLHNKKFTFDSTIKAIETEGELKIEGYASTTSLDRSSDIIQAAAWNKSGGLRNFELNPILLFNHNYDKPIGRVTDITVDNKGLKIKGTISKSSGDIYNLIKEGVLSTFSVGFMIKDADYDKEAEGLIIKDAELLEISVVSVPCNQDATFSVAKSFDDHNDYLAFRKQFETIPDNIGKNSKGATASRIKKMDEQTNEMIQKAVENALAAKAAADAAISAEKAAAEAAEVKFTAAVSKAMVSSEEKIMAELTKRFENDKTSLEEKLVGLHTELKEKAAEIQAMNSSKRVFLDSNNGGDWKKVYAKELDDAFLLGRITGKGYETDFAKDLIQKVNTMSSVSVSTDNYEREVSTNIERDIQNELILAPMFREIQMNSASMVLPVMPDTGYATVSAARALPGTSPNGTLNKRGDALGTTGGIAMDEVELRTIKMVAKSYLGNETEEDVIIPILPLLRDGMIRQHARGVENLILLGGHADGAYPTLTQASGLLKYASTSTRTVTAAGASTALTAAALVNLRKNMGKYGLRATDVVYIVSQSCYFELLEDAEFQDFNLVNQQATKLTGEIGQVFGSSVMVCDEFPAPAAGKYHALAVNTRNFVIPRQRGVTVESQYLVEEQHKVLATTQKLGFKEIIPNAKSVIGLKYA
jgi:HK97 family phage prohead protease